MSKIDVYGVDVGTMFFQVASKSEDGKLHIQTTRNAFVELDASEDIEEVLKQNTWQYVKDDKKYYVIGEDSMRVAQMFPGKVELRRPLQDGVLNKGEDKKMLVLSELISGSIGKAPTSSSVVCSCISSEAVDGNYDNTFHKARLQGFFKRLGWEVKIIEEGLAVVLSERPVLVEENGEEVPYSGIGISFGSGRVNLVLSYRGLQVVGMSCTHSGDYIDRMVSEQTDTPLAQVTKIKEKKLDFDNIDYDDDIIFALDAYYSNMIEYVFNHFAKKFDSVKSQFDAPIEIVVAGGTSMPKGFDKKLEEVIKGLDLPFSVKNIRRATDPRNAVVKGCLTQAVITQKRLKKNNLDVEIEKELE